VGSRNELEKLSGNRPKDLHKHFIDEITIPCTCGQTMRRIPEVLDCWFESGSMPYSQVHYPFENKEHFESHYPADFIAEGLDQTRGWFYTLTVLAAALFDKPAFQNCVVNGLVLAADGKKMSKSLRNYSDPNDVMEKFGADALRFFLMHSAAVKADDMCFSDEGVKEVLKSVFIPVWNAYGFFVTYANIDLMKGSETPKDVRNPLDRWILSVCEAMVKSVTDELEAYDIQRAIDPIVDFVDALNNWYIRRSRRRFWKSESDNDKIEAYATLRRVLERLSLVMAPFTPFMSEAIYLNIKTTGAPDSVHLCDFPEYDSQYRDETLEWKMSSARRAVSMGHALRAQFNIKNRQPLSAVHLVTRDPKEKAVLLEMEDVIRDELNVKRIVFRENEEDLVEFSVKANYRILGKELGKDMKAAAETIERLTSREIAHLLEGATLEIEVGGRALELTQEKVEVRRIEKEGLHVLNDKTLTVALDTNVTDELLSEGYARDLVRGVQALRKESGFAVTDRIALSASGNSVLETSFRNFVTYVAKETLASSAEWKEIPECSISKRAMKRGK
jgi:isoleucyl-tRNA synthetase